MTGLSLLNIMLNEGVEIKENHNDLVKEFDNALDEKRVIFITKDNEEIGFCTWEIKSNLGGMRVLINKCVIYKQFRNRFSLINLRHFMRDKFIGFNGFLWKSRKQKRMCFVK